MEDSRTRNQTIRPVSGLDIIMQKRRMEIFVVRLLIISMSADLYSKSECLSRKY